MAELNHSFEKLLGRQPTDSERQQLYKVRDALELGNNDAIWLVIMVLQHYETMYGKFPKLIASAAQKSLETFKNSTEAAAKASMEAAKADLALAVKEASEKTARAVAGTDRTRWIAACAITVTLGALCLGGSAYYVGQQSGRVAGYEMAKDEKAAAAWTNTPEGQRAYSFAQTGALQILTDCQGDGWEIKDGICYPYATPEGLYGWRVPEARTPPQPQPDKRRAKR